MYYLYERKINRVIKVKKLFIHYNEDRQMEDVDDRSEEHSVIVDTIGKKD